MRGPEPEKSRVFTFAEMVQRVSGWKFHINFDAEDPVKLQVVGSLLASLKEHDAIRQFKIGHGGGKAAGAPGKEATIYVGHRDKAAIVAPIIEEGLQGVLDPPEGDALKDDISFTNHVMGRFEIVNIDPEFHQYGAKGHGRLNEDIGRYLMPWHTKKLSEAESARLTVELDARADAVLRQRYGVFYTGTPG